MTTQTLAGASRRSFLALSVLASPLAMAQPQASGFRGPVRLVVGYPPGGPADVAARILAEGLGQELGQPVVVDNRPGAGGQLAARAVKGAPADGSVIFMSNLNTVVSIPLTVKEPGFSTLKDFRPVGNVATFELALAVHPKTSVGTLAELGRWMTAHPREASIGVPAPASPPEFVAQKIARTFNLSSVPVPYKGSAPLVTDLVGGQVMAGIAGIADFLQYHQAGRLKIVATTRATPLLPGVPSFAEAGIPGLQLTEILGLFAPAAVPDSVVQRYNAALNRVLAQPDIQERYRGQVMTTVPGSPEQQHQSLAQATEELAALVRESGFIPQ